MQLILIGKHLFFSSLNNSESWGCQNALPQCAQTTKMYCPLLLLIGIKMLDFYIGKMHLLHWCKKQSPVRLIDSGLHSKEIKIPYHI